MVVADKTDALHELKATINGLPFYAHMGMQITDLQDGYSRIELRMSPQVQTTRHSLHGGAIAALMDCANSMAANAAYLGEGLVVTVNLQVQFMRPGLGDVLVAESHVLYKARSLAFTEATLTDPASGKLIAKSTASCMVKPVGMYD